jgi:hypothetical protein
MLGRALSRQIPRQIPGVGAVAPRQIPFVAATSTRAFASNREAFDTKDRMVIPAVVKTKSGNMVRSPSAAEKSAPMDLLKDRLVAATAKAEAVPLPSRIDESNFRMAPETKEEMKFVENCFNMFDLNGNGVLEVWELNAVYESGSGSAVGACFIEAGLAGENRNSGLKRGKSVGNLEETVYTYGVDFTQNAQVLKAMDLVRAVKKGRVNVSGDMQFDRFVTKEEFTRWAMRLVELHSASRLEDSAVLDEVRPDVMELTNEALRM